MARRRKTIDENETQDQDNTEQDTTDNQTTEEQDTTDGSDSEIDEQTTDDTSKVEQQKEIKTEEKEPEPTPEVKKVQEFSNLTEMYEEKRYRIRARNKVDAEKLLKKELQSQDEIVNIHSVSKGYDALVLKFIAREYPVNEK